MKILVYGAGVLGCNLARNLFHAGKDVTLLARGNWAEEIRKNGLRIKDQFSLRTSVSNIPVVTELAPNVRYDVIFVVLRYTQLDSALDTLRANQTKNIVFVGNNVQARALAAGFDSKELQVGNGIWRVDMMKCPYHDTCVAYGCPELCCCFCDSDDISYTGLHPKLIWHRTKTLGRGDDRCDFCMKIMK